MRAEVVRAEVGSWKLEVGSWKLEVGSRKWEVGSWKLEAGSWKVALPISRLLPLSRATDFRSSRKKTRSKK